VNPLAAILLIAGRLPDVDPTFIPINEPMILTVWKSWAYRVCCRVYPHGGHWSRWAAIISWGKRSSIPDKLIASGPYRLVRHPMYTSALSIALGLACLIQSWVFFGVFCVYLFLILALVPVEEKALQKAYGKRYVAYAQKVSKLVPFVY